MSVNLNTQLLSYNGETCVKEFVHSFKLQAFMFKWSEEEQIAGLPLMLKQRALRIYNDKCKAKGSIKEQLDALVAACAPSQEILLHNFFALSRHHNESISSFARRLQECLIRAMPGLDQAEQAKLLRGQLYQHLSESLRALIQFNKECTWDELIEKLDNARIDAGAGDTSFNVSSDEFASPLIKKEPVDANWSQTSSGFGQRSNPKKRFEGNCYKCNKPGHRAADCRSSGLGGGSGGNSGGANYRASGNGGFNRGGSGRSSNDPRRSGNNDSGNNQNRGKSNQASANVVTAQQEYSEFPFYGDLDITHIDLNYQAKLLKVPLEFKIYDLPSIKVEALVDSGSSLSFISPKILSEGQKRHIDDDTKVKRSRIVVNGATGSTEAESFKVTAKVQVGDGINLWVGSQSFLISSGVTRFDAILGRDFLQAQKAKVDHGACSMEIGKRTISLNSLSTSSSRSKPEDDDRVARLEARIQATQSETSEVKAQLATIIAMMQQQQLAQKQPEPRASPTRTEEAKSSEAANAQSQEIH